MGTNRKEQDMTEEQEQMIQDCSNRWNKLTSWEASFIDDIQYREALTPKQDETLTQIWERVTS